MTSYAHCSESSRISFPGVSYREMEMLLDAGYNASLSDFGEETTHFTVIKNQNELHAAQGFLSPFVTWWRESNSGRMPALILISIKASSTNTAMQAQRCEWILESMANTAKRNNLWVRKTTRLPMLERRSLTLLKHRLAIPSNYVPLGIIGFSYIGTTNQTYSYPAFQKEVYYG